MNDNEGLPPGEQVPEGADVAPMSADEIIVMLMLDKYRQKLELPDDFEVKEEHLRVARASAEIALAAAACVMDMVDAEKVVNYATVADGETPTAVVMVGSPDPKLLQAFQATYHAFNSLVRDTPK